MPNNIHRFRRTKWADPKRLEMIADLKSKQSVSRYLSSLVALCMFVGFVAVQAWPRLSSSELAKPLSTSISVFVIVGDTISLNDGRPNVRLVGFNAPEASSRARCDAELQKGVAAKQRLLELVSNGRSEFHQVACSCVPGTEGTDACNFGRAVERFESMAWMWGQL
ncbi:hypothetical protein [Bradyrhizobium sp. JYMT SZCCT0428]|uniref:hypothetical protein n=1 Tax=Bradyrhizobium sp. JYMT SZCCT0428 TaxID=2807673 RepID=UPI0020122F93|nr:hypothetical protein [Bradyrhizobium sp. JYMT SZCCT0428]